METHDAPGAHVSRQGQPGPLDGRAGETVHHYDIDERVIDLNERQWPSGFEDTYCGRIEITGGFRPFASRDDLAARLGFKSRRDCFAARRVQACGMATTANLSN